MSFARIAKELREETGLSQQKLADKLGLSSSGIAHWELGQSEPGCNVILAYARYFDVSADYLLGLEDDFGVRTAAPSSASAQNGTALTAEESRVLEQYRGLPEQLRKLIRQQLDVYSSPEELLSKPNKKV